MSLPPHLAVDPPGRKGHARFQSRVFWDGRCPCCLLVLGGNGCWVRAQWCAPNGAPWPDGGVSNSRPVAQWPNAPMPRPMAFPVGVQWPMGPVRQIAMPDAISHMHAYFDAPFIPKQKKKPARSRSTGVPVFPHMRGSLSVLLPFLVQRARFRCPRRASRLMIRCTAAGAAGFTGLLATSHHTFRAVFYPGL